MDEGWTGDQRMRVVAFAAAAVLLVVGGLSLFPGDEPPSGGEAGVALDRPGDPGSTAPGARREGSPRRLYVHVAGEVRRPGLYQVPAGSRVAAALDRAGGPTDGADLTAINLASPVKDGQQIIFPAPGQRRDTGITAGSGGAGGSGAGDKRISLASATPQQLDELDGIGPKLAARIVEYRTAHGGFRSVDELQEVDGIGAKRFERLRKAVRP